MTKSKIENEPENKKIKQAKYKIRKYKIRKHKIRKQNNKITK